MENSTAASSSASEHRPEESHLAAALKRMLSIALMILSIALVAYVVSERVGPRDSTNLVGLVGSVSIDPEPLLESSQAGEIEDAIRSELGYRLMVPVVVGAEILGIGTWDADRNVRIPVVSYDDPEGDIKTVLILNYAMLDRISSAVFLDRSLRLELEQDNSFAVVSGSGTREIVLWRSGDDILLAIAEKGAGRLIPRITKRGSSLQG